LAQYFLADFQKVDLGYLPINSQAMVKRFASVVFGSRLLVPAGLLRAEVNQVDLKKDMVLQLAERFWVSRNMINRRLKEVITEAQ